jgi:hydroxymethylpyrimidine/phosphomethylpyrimidine kinase
VITPNLDEAALLLGRNIDGIAALDAAVADLLAMGAPAVLLKGGHLSGDLVMDVLGRQGQQASDYLRLQSQRIVTHNGHGTGCTLSSAIASFLAQGLALEAAVTEARAIFWAPSRRAPRSIPARVTAPSITAMRRARS